MTRVLDRDLELRRVFGRFAVHAHQAADDAGALVFHACGYLSLA